MRRLELFGSYPVLRGILFLSLILIPLAPKETGGLSGQGANLWAGELVYDSKGDWLNNWTFPKGTLEITDDGWVRPPFIHKNINACLNASQFVTERDRSGNPIKWGGIIAAGSNLSSAKNILDGDMGTSWGPRKGDELKDCWVEVDLGRLVTATKVVLRFSPTGKPFEQFEVYVSDGTEAFYPGSKVKNYKLAGRTTQPNREYVLEYPLKREVVNGEEVERQMVRYVYLELTSHPEDPGQLAELEVYSLGDNVMLGTLDRAGSLVAGEYGGKLDPKSGLVADGNYNTTWNAQTVVFDWKQKGWLHVDLGNLFWLDAIRIVGQARQGLHPLLGYKLFVSDGSLAPGGTAGGERIMGNFVWQEVASLEKNPPEGENVAIYVFEDTFSPRPVQHIFFSHRNNEKDRGTAVRVEITEIQGFGEGYVPGATLSSNLIDLGRANNLTSIEWEASTPPGTKVEIRTRTGDQIEEITHYYCRNGLECTKRDQNREIQLFGSSGPVVVEQRPDTTWSGWSRPYLPPGDRFASPSPRRYLLMQAKLLSDRPDAAPSLDSITLFYTDPVAEMLTGRIWPTQVKAGVPQDFSYLIQPSFGPANRGFDEILIKTPSPAELFGVKVGDVDYSPAELDSVHTTADFLWVRLPLRVRYQAQPLVEVSFRCTVFGNATLFDAFVADSRRKDSWQRVDPTKANATTVMLPVTEEIIGRTYINPKIITPNKDGINDQMIIEFAVFKINIPQMPSVTIYNLQGEAVRKLDAKELMGRDGLSGNYQATWDGRDDSGESVLPGLYLCRIRVDTGTGEAVVNRTVAVGF